MCEKTIFDYLPYIEKDHPKYFFGTFGQTKWSLLMYKTKAISKKTTFGFALFNKNIKQFIIYKNKKLRKYSKNEYKNVIKELKEDAKIKERTLDFKSKKDTILNAIILLEIHLIDPELKIIMSRYETHGFEYAGDVLVLDFYQNKEKIQTVEKYNYDGPF